MTSFIYWENPVNGYRDNIVIISFCTIVSALEAIMCFVLCHELNVLLQSYRVVVVEKNIFKFNFTFSQSLQITQFVDSI